MNKVFLIGRLTDDPKIAFTTNGIARCVFNIAVRRPSKQGDEAGVDFPRIVAWGATAENCDRYLEKGRQVAVDGRITTGSYKGRDGKVVYTTEVTADRVEFLGNHSNENIRAEEREDREEQAKQIEQKAQELFGTDFQMDDIPF